MYLRLCIEMKIVKCFSSNAIFKEVKLSLDNIGIQVSNTLRYS